MEQYTEYIMSNLFVRMRHEIQTCNETKTLPHRPKTARNYTTVLGKYLTFFENNTIYSPKAEANNADHLVLLPEEKN